MHLWTMCNEYRLMLMCTHICIYVMSKHNACHVCRHTVSLCIQEIDTYCDYSCVYSRYTSLFDEHSQKICVNTVGAHTQCLQWACLYGACRCAYNRDVFSKMHLYTLCKNSGCAHDYTGCTRPTCACLQQMCTYRRCGVNSRDI